jgi:PAS domain S-box-containing protein
MCGNILCGRFDPAKDFFTPHGSFWSNCTTELLASTTEEDRQARTRNRCNGEGYESVGLFPLRLGGETFGLLQVNDKQKGLFTLRMLSSLEWFGDNLAIALARLRAEEELRETEERFQTLATLAPVGVYLTDPDGNCLYANTAWCRMAGLSLEDALGQGWIKGLHPDDRAFVFSSWQQMVESQGEWGLEYRFQTREGIVTTVYGLAAPQYDVSGKIIRYIGVNLDITDRKLAEEALREKGEILSATQRLAKVGGWQWDVETQTMSWTEEAYRIHDLEEDRFISGSPEHIDRSMECYMPEHRPLIMAAFKNCVEHGQSYDLEFPFVTFKGRRLWIRTVAQAVLYKGRIVKVMGNIMDITDRKSAEDNIYALLSEKELLLREVHHRIKNNMNVIISLLSLQSSTLKDPSAISSLEDARNRVRSMMVLYDKLYQSPNFREVSVKEYLTSLIDEIMDNLLNHESVTIEKQIDDLILDAKTLSSVGIILNELLSNAVKHAFIGRDNGTIWVSFSLKDNHAVLVVRDNGTGIPESFDIATSTGFGMQLVGILTEQLEGTIQVERRNGMRFIMEFDV